MKFQLENNMTCVGNQKNKMGELFLTKPIIHLFNAFLFHFLLSKRFDISKAL